VVIDLGKSQLFIGQVAELIQDVSDFYFTCLEPFQ